MQKLAIFKLLVGLKFILLLAQFTSNELIPIGHHLSSADFDAIERRYLDSSDYVRDQYENNLDRLKQRKFKFNGDKHVVDVIDKLSKLTGCNEQALELLESVAMATNYLTVTHRKIDQLVLHYAKMVAKQCKPFLIRSFESLRKLFKEYEWFSRAHGLGKLGRDELVPLAIHRPGMPEYFMVETKSQGEILRQVATGDSRNHYGNVLKNAHSLFNRYEKIAYDNFRSVYYDHLYKPCKEHNEIIGQLVPRAYATVRLLQADQLRLENIWQLFADFPREFESSVFRYYLCKSVTNSDNNKQMEEYLIEQDQQNALDLLNAGKNCSFSNLLKKLVCLNE